VAPPNSFIHAGDFNNDPKELAKYLNRVANDLNLYTKFFEWKKLYKSQFIAHSVEQARLCELCYRLNTQERVGYYESVSQFFNRDCHRV
jgi:hypothetical protein